MTHRPGTARRPTAPARWSPPAAVTALALAAAPALAAQNVLAETYTELDGLPSSRVLDIHPAPCGRLWFATRTGLFAFDGATWHPALPEIFPARREVRFVRFDAEGVPWALCSDGVLLSPSPDAPSPPVSVHDDAPAGVLLDFELGAVADRCVPAVVTSSAGVLLYEEGGWRAAFADGAPRAAVVAEPCFDRLFVGTYDGLRVLDREGHERPVWIDRLPAGPVRGLSAERGAGGEELWIAGDGWIGRVDASGEWKLVATGLPVIETPRPSPLAIAADGLGGAVWGNSWVVHHVDGRTGRTRLLDRGAGLPLTGVNGLCRDASGLIWGASDLGAFKLVRLDVATFTERHGLFDEEVSAVALLDDGRMLLGHPGGLTFVSGDVRAQHRFLDVDPKLLAGSRVMDLCQDERGRTWIAAAGLGVGLLGADDVPRWTKVPEGLGSWANAVESDGEGGLLVGTTYGVVRLVDGRFESLEGAPARPFVRRIERGADGTVYLATSDGIWVGRDGAWTHLRSELRPGVFEHFFTCYEDRSGRVWCGSADGLLRIEGSRLVRDPALAELRRPVYSLVEDGRGRLWIGTDYGFQYLDGERLVPLDWIAEHTGHEANRAAAALDADGNLWLGTTKGVTRFEPSFDVPSDPPVVELFEVSVAGEVLPLGAGLRIDANARDIHFRSRAGSMWVGDRIEFRSRLADLTPWKLSSGPPVHDALFTSLPPGRYRYEVQARLPGGRFSPVVASPELAVLGPLWTRPWFLALLVVVSAGAGVAAHRALVLRRHAAQLEREVDERTAELEETLRELAKTDRLRTLGILGGGIAHDLRNLLTILTGNLSLLRTGGAGAGREQVLDSMESALDRATQMASQFQTFATGAVPLTRATSLREVIADSAQIVMVGSRVRLDLDFAEDLPPVEADPGQIRQVFENLLVNARQCQPDGGWIRVRATSVRLAGGDETPDGLAPGRYLEIAVSDGGPGVPAEDAARIFEPFYTTKASGSGLGLATALSIVRRHGGTMRLDGAPGPTTFRVLLPASSSQPATNGSAVPERLDARGRRVLVVDDEQPIRALLESMLKHLGFEARSAANEREALEIAREARDAHRPFDIAVLDLTIPGDAPGQVILSNLRRIQPGLRAVASSGNFEEAALAGHERYGFEGALPKPYRVDDLRRTLIELDGGAT